MLGPLLHNPFSDKFLQSERNAGGSIQYTYDRSGNLTKKAGPEGVASYTYTAQNKLQKGTNELGETSEYTYNALGVRTQNIQIRDNSNAAYADARLD